MLKTYTRRELRINKYKDKEPKLLNLTKRIPLYLLPNDDYDFHLVGKHWFDKHSCVNDQSFLDSCLQMDDFISKSHFDSILKIGTENAILPSGKYEISEDAESYFSTYNRGSYNTPALTGINLFRDIQNEVNSKSVYFEIVEIFDEEPISKPDQKYMNSKYTDEYYPDWWDDSLYY